MPNYNNNLGADASTRDDQDTLRVAQSIIELRRAGMSGIAVEALELYVSALNPEEHALALAGLTCLAQAGSYSNARNMAGQATRQSNREYVSPFRQFLDGTLADQDTVNQCMNLDTVSRGALAGTISEEFGLSNTQTHRLGAVAVWRTYPEAARHASTNRENLTGAIRNITKKINEAQEESPDLLRTVIEEFLSNLDGNENQFKKGYSDQIIADQVKRLLDPFSTQITGKKMRSITDHLTGTRQFVSISSMGQTISIVRSKLDEYLNSFKKSVDYSIDPPSQRPIPNEHVRIVKLLLGNQSSGSAPKSYAQIILQDNLLDSGMKMAQIQKIVCDVLQRL